jgi:hypothetical protein
MERGRVGEGHTLAGDLSDLLEQRRKRKYEAPFTIADNLAITPFPLLVMLPVSTHLERLCDAAVFHRNVPAIEVPNGPLEAKQGLLQG